MVASFREVVPFSEPHIKLLAEKRPCETREKFKLSGLRGATSIVVAPYPETTHFNVLEDVIFILFSHFCLGMLGVVF